MTNATIEDSDQQHKLFLAKIYEYFLIYVFYIEFSKESSHWESKTYALVKK